MTTSPFRQEIELMQNYSKHKTFTFTIADNSNAQTAVTIPGNMEECNKVSFIVETGDLYVGFDEDATATTMLIPANEGYFDDSIYIGSKISVKRSANSGTPRIRGIIWGR
tara:strand:+ start:189 stop:518 length:330 start_codon:yes stop_codon:yes gene_type:complete